MNFHDQHVSLPMISELKTNSVTLGFLLKSLFTYLLISTENRFFFHTKNPNHSFHPQTPLLSAPPHLHSTPIFIAFHFVFRKEQVSKRWQPNRAKQGTLRYSQSPHMKCGQGPMILCSTIMVTFSTMFKDKELNVQSTKANFFLKKIKLPCKI